MKKSIYLAAIAALALTACSSDNNEIFDQSAADRLEQYKQNYHDVLTENGGLWTMEYFSNAEEPGYLFIMKFDKNGSVTIGANHKWIGNTYKEETSLWRMMADNGPVLSFCSYNNLFHIFSDPANITGSDAPSGESGDDINETGYGHEGDYEFQVMEVSEDHNTIRLLGKKRLYHIYMHRLDPSTDMKAYMDEYKTLESSVFCKEITNIILHNLDGEDYNVSGCETGIMSVSPKNGDSVEQTRKGNFIVTMGGIRFMEPFEIVNSKGDERMIEEFKFVDKYSLALVGNEEAVLNAGNFADIMMNNRRNWKVNLKELEGSAKSTVDAFVSQLKSLYNYKSANLTDMSLDYDTSKKSYVLRFYLRISSKGYETDKFLVSIDETEAGIKIKVDGAYDNASQMAYNAYSEMQNLINLITSSTIKATWEYDCAPKTVKLAVDGGSMTINSL